MNVVTAAVVRGGGGGWGLGGFLLEVRLPVAQAVFMDDRVVMEDRRGSSSLQS